MSREPRHDFPALPAVETLRDPLYAARGVTLGVLRLDLLHPLWGGNKLFKLLPNLRRAEALGLRRVISFGGAHSNHLHALAAWGREHGLQTVGIVRGEAPVQPGPTLRDLHDRGMRIRHVSRAAYRRRADPAWVEELTRDLMPALVIPEGGDNAEGFAGCRELGRSIAALEGGWDVIALACGTGTTLAGLVAGSGAFVLGVAALRDAAGITARAAGHLGPDSSGQSTVGPHSCGQIPVGPDASGHHVRMTADPRMPPARASSCSIASPAAASRASTRSWPASWRNSAGAAACRWIRSTPASCSSACTRWSAKAVSRPARACWRCTPAGCRARARHRAGA